VFAQILPGFREVRGPLASGFLWLLLGYLIFHGDVASAHGKVRDVVELGRKLNPAALAVAASFVAYLLGSLSEDLFRRTLISRVRRRVSFNIDSARAPEARESQVFADTSESFRETQVVRLENEADKLSAESDLRLAILPPLVALILFLTINERALWLLGLVFAAGLGAQVWLRTRDYLIARESLFSLRRDVGIPPASAAEAESRDDAPKPDVKLGVLDFARKGTTLLNRGEGFDHDEAEEWADEASAFVRAYAPDRAPPFLRIEGDGARDMLEKQVAVLQDIASFY